MNARTLSILLLQCRCGALLLCCRKQAVDCAAVLTQQPCAELLLQRHGTARRLSSYSASPRIKLFAIRCCAIFTVFICASAAQFVASRCSCHRIQSRRHGRECRNVAPSSLQSGSMAAYRLPHALLTRT
jgi:hypothetical protein